jgi:predicted dehydrogenase
MHKTLKTTPAAKQPSLRLGILGCANIARQFCRDVQTNSDVVLAAVASRDTGKSQTFASAFGIERSHGSYEALLQDNDIDAVYVPLPNSMHAQWAIEAARHGKHILCEKPLCLGVDEAVSMFRTARENGVFLLESYPWWFQPQTGDMIQLLGTAIGDVRSVHASFGFTMANADTNIRSKPELGGGALMDAGSYPLSLVRLVMGKAPAHVRADAIWADSGVDISTQAQLFFEGSQRAFISCAMNAANHRHATIAGTAGTIETEYLNHTSHQHDHPWGHLPSQLRVRRGTANTIPFEDIRSATGSGFRFAAEAFAKVVRENDQAAIDRAAQASLDIAATIEAIARSSRSGRTEPVHQMTL